VNGSLIESQGVRLFVLDEQGPPIGAESDAIDLIGEGAGHDARFIVVPVSRLHPDFLRLSTRMAGFFIQKLTNYGYGFAVVGDISAATGQSSALADFVRESNRGRAVFFLPDVDSVCEKLVQTVQE
jgi:hypothetical protein